MGHGTSILSKNNDCNTRKSKKQKQNAVAQFSLSHRGNHLTPEKLLNASQLKHFSSIERHCTNVIVQSGK